MGQAFSLYFWGRNAMNPKGYVCYRAGTPLVIDGCLDKPAWDAASWTDDFVDIEADTQPLPPLRTRVKMLWDDTYFYIAAQMEEPHVWATLTKHDSVIFQDNDFEIFIDPDGDNHDYYEIEINALNTVWDLRLVKPYRDGGPALNEWEIPGLKTEVWIDGTLNDPRDRDQGWCVELAIPWQVLGQYARCPSPPADGDQWRVNFSRVEWDVMPLDGRYDKVPNRPEHNWVWSPQGVVDMHQPERWGFVQFTTLPPATAVFRPDPSLAARDYLMQVYHAQQAFRREQGRWASSFAELGLSKPPLGTNSSHLTLTPAGFEAQVGYVSDQKAARLLCVRADSRLRHIDSDAKFVVE